MLTIGRRLTDAASLGMVFRWLRRCGRCHPDSTFIYHHQPFAYFADYATGTAGRSEHLKDERDMLRAIGTDTPRGQLRQADRRGRWHPGYASVVRGDYHAASIVYQIQQSLIWDDAVIIITYAENGGIWDHVAPPKMIAGDQEQGCRQSLSRHSPRGTSLITQRTIRLQYSN